MMMMITMNNDDVCGIRKNVETTWVETDVFKSKDKWDFDKESGSTFVGLCRILPGPILGSRLVLRSPILIVQNDWLDYFSTHWTGHFVQTDRRADRLIARKGS